MFDYKIRDYLMATKDPVITPQILSQPSSKNKIILFLKSKDMVNFFLAQQEGFQMECNFIKYRRRTEPTIKIISLKFRLWSIIGSQTIYCR